MLNPLRWPRPHQMALLLTFVVGAIFGVLLGYIIYALGDGPSAISFSYWVNRPIRYGALPWSVFGGLVGSAIIYIRHLAR